MDLNCYVSKEWHAYKTNFNVQFSNYICAIINSDSFVKEINFLMGKVLALFIGYKASRSILMENVPMAVYSEL